MCLQSKNCNLKVVPRFRRNTLIYVFSICHTTLTHVNESVSGRKPNIDIQFDMVYKISVAILTSTMSDKRNPV